MGASRAPLVEHVASLVENVATTLAAPPPAGQVALQIDGRGRPVGLLLPLHRDGDASANHRLAPVSLRVSLSTPITELAQRVAARPETCRFDPVVCVDDLGHAIGIVRIENILLRLADLKAGTTGADFVTASQSARQRRIGES